MLLVPQSATAIWRVFRASVCLFFPLVLGLTILICSGAVSVTRYFQVPAKSPEGRHDRVFSFFFASSLSNCFFIFCLSFLCVCLFFFVFSLSYSVYVVPVVFSMMTWHCIVYSAYCIPANTAVASMWRSFVTTELVSL